MDGVAETVHATCIALDGRGVLIRGPSGSGKSDLALRCLATVPNSLISQPAALVADDQVEVEVLGGRLMARAPVTLRGRLEVRGQGIISLSTVETAEVVLVAELVPPDMIIDRLPDPVLTFAVCGIRLPVIRMHAYEASAAAKLLIALVTHHGRIIE